MRPAFPRFCFLLPLLAALALIPLPASLLRAQPVPMKHTYGLADTQFVVMSITQIHGDTAHGRPWDDLWPFLDSMGVDIAEVYSWPEPEEVEALTSSRRIGRPYRMVAWMRMREPGHGIEIQLYPFAKDSSQSSYFRSGFTERSGGREAFNAAEPGGPREQIYDSSTTIPGQVVASGLAFDREPWQRRRRDMRAGLLLKEAALSFGRSRSPFSFVVTGHLAGPPVADTMNLLKVEIYQEAMAGEDVLGTDTTYVRYPRDTSFLLRTIYITAGDLSAGIAPRDRYREISIPDSLLRRPDGAPGPYRFNQPDGGRRLDIRVSWLGGGAVALRSIAIRDAIGEKVLGRSETSELYRAAIIDDANRILYGTPTPPPGAVMRRSVVRLYGCDEPRVVEGAGWAYIDTMIRAGHAIGRGVGDSLPIFGGQIEAARIRNINERATPEEVVPELYFPGAQDTARKYGRAWENVPGAGGALPLLQNRYRAPHNTLPRIAEHNGGRFQIPLLLTLDSARRGLYRGNLAALRRRVESYELTFQRTKLGWGTTANIPWPYTVLPLNYLAAGAEVARDRGRRMIVGIGEAGAIDVNALPGDAAPDVRWEMPEPSETRALINLGLCYGARGVRHNIIGSYNNILEKRGSHWVGTFDNIGIGGGVIGSDTADVFRPFQLTSTDPTDTVTRLALDDFYVGHRSRGWEMKSMNRWLHRVGPQLCAIRWRAGYSIHFAGAPTGVYPVSRDLLEQGYDPIVATPLPAGEIVSRVTARDPLTGALDPDTSTFVELGLFYTKSGGSRFLDTNHIFLVNRRAFELPADPADPGRPFTIVDSLAEARTISVRFNIPEPDSIHLNFIHVREIEPDTTPLPLSRIARRGLDTIVKGDSAVELTLRPGGGALLRITYLPERIYDLGMAGAGALRNAMAGGDDAVDGAAAVTSGPSVPHPAGSRRDRSPRSRRDVSRRDRGFPPGETE